VADAKAKLLEDFATPEWLVLSPAADAALAKDADSGALYANQAAAVTGKLPNVHGFSVVTSGNVVSPAAGQYACLGFERSAFGIAFGDLTSQSDAAGRTIEKIVDAASGIVFTMVSQGTVNGLDIVIGVQYGVITLDKSRACLVRC
jgi:hypothetical protein